MKNTSICYGENAIKVSSSYCSRPSKEAYNSQQLTPSIKNAVTCIYKVKLSTDQKQLLIKLNWCNQLTQGFSISICDYPFSYSEFSRNFTILRKIRGMKTFESCSFRIDVFWDLYGAKYESGPEPVSGYYLLILVNSELSLILGDMAQELEVKKLISDIQVSKFSLISRSEYFSGNAVYSTRAKFTETGTCHDILIKCFGEDGTTFKNPVLSVYIDKKNVIQVKRLQWNFRGNETIFLDGLLVDMMWNVHDWFFSSSKGCGFFMFRRRSGLNRWLWLADKNDLEQENEEEKVDQFSLLLSACKNPG